MSDEAAYCERTLVVSADRDGEIWVECDNDRENSCGYAKRLGQSAFVSVLAQAVGEHCWGPA